MLEERPVTAFDSLPEPIPFVCNLGTATNNIAAIGIACRNSFAVTCVISCRDIVFVPRCSENKDIPIIKIDGMARTAAAMVCQ